MVKVKVIDFNDFMWFVQLRYYWENDVIVRMIIIDIKYGYEYLGNFGCFVIIFLIDRCYRYVFWRLVSFFLFNLFNIIIKFWYFKFTYFEYYGYVKVIFKNFNRFFLIFYFCFLNFRYFRNVFLFEIIRFDCSFGFFICINIYNYYDKIKYVWVI